MPCRNFVLCILGSLSTFFANSQSKDSVLIHETTLTRPLVVHKNQFRTNVGYRYANYDVEFVGDERTRLPDVGNSEPGHGFNLNLEYGIRENLQLGLSISSINQSKITEKITIVNDPYYDVYYIQEHQGLTDPKLTVTYRLPLPQRMDFLLSVLGSIPIMDFGNTTPAHQIILNDPGDPDSNIPPYYELSYVDRSGAGSGTSFLGLGTAFKYRFTDLLAVTIVAQYEAPQGTSDNHKWLFELVDNAYFTYSSSPYQTQIPDKRGYAFALEYQAFPSLNVYGNIKRLSQKYGWTQFSGQKVKTYDTELTSFQLGYEIIVTSNIWINQYVEIPISGTHIQAPTIVNFQLRYNLMFK